MCLFTIYCQYDSVLLAQWCSFFHVQYFWNLSIAMDCENKIVSVILSDTKNNITLENSDILDSVKYDAIWSLFRKIALIKIMHKQLTVLGR